MMKNKVCYFPVGTADMSLVQLSNGFTILVDCYLQNEVTENRPAVADNLYDRLPDDQGRPYVDAFLLNHPDQDHCKGAKEFLHLDRPDDYNDDPNENERKKIFIREIWSSPLIYRRRSKDHKLCDDAAAVNAEAKKRVEIYRHDNANALTDGNRILFLAQTIQMMTVLTALKALTVFTSM